jgi:type IV secretion system protein VirB6
MRHLTLRFIASCLFVLATALIVWPHSASAQTPPDTCTGFKESAQKAFDNPSQAPADGLLSDIYSFITDVTYDATENLFNAFVNSTSYQNALYWAMSLMVVVFGVGFTIGVVQPSFQQVLVRLFKLGVLFALVSPDGWEFFSDYVVNFFQDGTDDLIKGVQEIGTGIAAPQGATPFYALDRLAEFIIQPDTITAIMGTLAAGPYGITMGGLMIIAFYGFFMLILKALRVYAITFVARALLLGIAPLFLIFLMFEKTKGLFTAWLNALVNLSLQPILLFTFLSFFLVLIETSARDMLGTEFCWQEFKNIDGSMNKAAFWRPVDGVTKSATTEMTWQGSLECLTSPQNTTGDKCAEFPINIVDMLSFLVLIYLAQRFTEVVERISSELSNAFVGLDTQGKLDQMFSHQGGGKHGGGLNIKQK